MGFHGNDSSSDSQLTSRRNMFVNTAKSVLAMTMAMTMKPNPSNALLIQFPILSSVQSQSLEDSPSPQHSSSPHQSAQRTLKNKYHFIRAGTSELEANDIYSTNPLFLTNRDNALSKNGYNELSNSVENVLKNAGECQPTVCYHSLSANSMDTGDYIAKSLNLGRDRLLPEFTYLDRRGIGLWDCSSSTEVEEAIWALDHIESGVEGRNGRPPSNTDGAPNDTLHDQFIRLRQFISLQETRTSGDIILVIFPDGTGPALLECMIAGIPYNEVHLLEYRPGEIRLDISVESITKLYNERKNDEVYYQNYLTKIQNGLVKLDNLKNQDKASFSVTYKDKMLFDDDDEVNKEYNRKQKEITDEKQRIEKERRDLIQENLKFVKEKKNLQKQQLKEDKQNKEKELLLLKFEKQEKRDQLIKEKQMVYEQSKKSDSSKSKTTTASSSTMSTQTPINKFAT